MQNSSPLTGRPASKPASRRVLPAGRTLGARLIVLASLGARWSSLLVQILYATGATDLGLRELAAVLYAYLLWAVALGVGQVLIRGEARPAGAVRAAGRAVHRRHGDLPDAVRPLHRLHRLEPQLVRRPRASTASTISSALFARPVLLERAANMVFYVLAVLVEYAIAFGLALLLNADIRARKFFRVAFLLPFMLSPVAVSWMIGKSMMEYRFGPAAHAGALSRLGQPGLLRLALDRAARASMAMDAWVSIPFMMIMLLAGLQALPQGGPGSGQGRRRQRLAVVLADHLPADAAGQRHRRSSCASSSS